MHRTTITALAALALTIPLVAPADATDGLALKAYKLAHKADVAAKLADRHAGAAYAVAIGTAAKLATIKSGVGPQGLSGVTGTAGSDGSDGVGGSNGKDGAPGGVGPQGVQGGQGPRGVQGDRGERGDVGPAGDKGDTGAQGPAGQDATGEGVQAFGYVSASGAGTSTQGATVTHPGNGLYCVNAPGLTALVVSPDLWGTTPYVSRPGSAGSSCPAAQWMVVLQQDNGADVGFSFIGQ